MCILLHVQAIFFCFTQFISVLNWLSAFLKDKKTGTDGKNIHNGINTSGIEKWGNYIIVQQEAHMKLYCSPGKEDLFNDISYHQLNFVLELWCFIGRRNRSTWRKPPTCRKSLTNFITYLVSSTPRHERE